ncbi:MAG: hypothetical protein K2X31_10820, partial [Sphingopyxis sp.]|nr:hypothetical protein [Sphingopyxis sp.]
GKPPVEHRFRKGQSGNPLGRPRKARSSTARHPPNRLLGSHEPTNQLILEEGYRLVKVRDGETVREMPVNQAVLRAMLQNALKGNRLAQRDFTMLMRTIEAEQRALQIEYFQELATYKWDAEKEIARCRKLGIEPPPMVPHPDDIKLDFNAGTALVDGPFTPGDKEQFDRLVERRDLAAAEVANAATSYKRTRSEHSRAMWMSEWIHEQRLFDIINDRLPERYRIELQHRNYGETSSRAGDFAPGQKPNWRGWKKPRLR